MLDFADMHCIYADIVCRLETVKESRKILNCHFDLQLVPTDPVGTFLYCEETDIITQKTQNC